MANRDITSEWYTRVMEDADSVVTHMREQGQQANRVTFSIPDIMGGLHLGRERVSNAIVLLVSSERMMVQGIKMKETQFYLPPGV
jgi:hypothetical protein